MQRFLERLSDQLALMGSTRPKELDDEELRSIYLRWRTDRNNSQMKADAQKWNSEHPLN
jgi:hypothetical protein